MVDVFSFNVLCTSRKRDIQTHANVSSRCSPPYLSIHNKLAIVIGGGDYPHLSKACLMSFPDTDGKCTQDETPMLNFGSTFRNLDNVLPNMIAMPTTSHHLSCFSTWAYNLNTEGAKLRTCSSFAAAGHKDSKGSLVFGEEAGLKFEVRNQAKSFVRAHKL